MMGSSIFMKSADHRTFNAPRPMAKWPGGNPLLAERVVHLAQLREFFRPACFPLPMLFEH